jgi:hypothetical protein
MDTIMSIIKFLELFALESFVLIVMGAVLIAWLYQIVRDKVRESRRLDEVASETNSMTPTDVVVP